MREWTVTGIRIRDADAADTEAIARVAIATGQDEEWAGADPAYVRHLLARGRLVVAEYRGAVTGFGATIRIGAGHPASRPLLAAGWRNDFLDVFMATDPGLLDPRRAVPSPPFA